MIDVYVDVRKPHRICIWHAEVFISVCDGDLWKVVLMNKVCLKVVHAQFLERCKDDPIVVKSSHIDLKRACNKKKQKTEDHWSCIAHLSAENMLKSAVIGEKKFKHSPRVEADNLLGPNILCKQQGLITMVIFCKLKKNLFNPWLYTHLFMI